MSEVQAQPPQRVVRVAVHRSTPQCQNALPKSALSDRDEGLWKSGKRHGWGTFNWAGGERYTGEFKAYKKQGQGTYYSSWVYN
jgi:hypothetical protein